MEGLHKSYCLGMEKFTVFGPLICPSTINSVFKGQAVSFPSKHTNKYNKKRTSRREGGREGRRERKGSLGKQEGVIDPNGSLGGRGEGK